MKQHKNRRIVMSMYAAAVSMVILTGFTSLAAEADTKVRRPESVKEESAEWNFSDIAGGIQQDILEETKALRKRSRLMKRSWRKSGKPQRKRRGSRLRRRLLRRPHRPTGNFLHL